MPLSPKGLRAVRVLVAGVALLVGCEFAAAAGCGRTLQATDLGSLSTSLSRANLTLLHDVSRRAANAASAHAGGDSGAGLDASYDDFIAAMKVQAAVDRLAVLTQLRDLMRQSEDREIIRGAIESFAMRAAAELSDSTLTRLAARADANEAVGSSSSLMVVRQLAGEAATLLASCR